VKFKYIGLAVLMLVSGCVTTSGVYRVSGVEENGQPINTDFTVKGRQIYSVRNAICAQYPNATVHIVSLETGKNLEDESPYKCD
jgi:hypothetical protein